MHFCFPSSRLDAKRIEGAQLKYTWKQLERGKDNYTFDNIRHDLAFLNAKGKRLFIQVQDSSFSLDIVPFPKYLLNDPRYHGGAEKQYNVESDDVEHAKPYGWVARRWDPAVRDRFQKLLFALGKEFDGKIEGINLPETAVDIVESGTLSPKRFSPQVYRDAIVSNMTVLKQAFPKSVAMQYANFNARGEGRHDSGISAEHLSEGGRAEGWHGWSGSLAVQALPDEPFLSITSGDSGPRPDRHRRSR